jgi:type IV pilus assembly protein PilC
VKANVPLVKALETSITQADNKRFKEILKQIEKDVNGGKSFAKSLAKHDHIFDKLYIHLVEVGELAGILDDILFRLSSYMEKRYSLKQKVRTALAYPTLVVAVAIGAVLFLMFFIVPTFADMYKSFNAQLPAPTRIVLSISQGLINYFPYILIGVAGFGYGIRIFVSHPRGRYLTDRLKLRTPFFGTIYQKTIMTRFCQTLGTLLKSGINLVEALTILEKASGNLLLIKATKEMKRSVKKGGSLTKSLKKLKVFPVMVIQMISVGEETSELDNMLLHIASLYDEETDIAVESLTSIIEPILIVVLGIVLGAIIVAMYLPIFELANVIR